MSDLHKSKRYDIICMFITFWHRLDMGNVLYLHLTTGAKFYDLTFQDRYVSRQCRLLFGVSALSSEEPLRFLYTIHDSLVDAILFISCILCFSDK